MINETLISLFLSYPIGLIVNQSSDKLKDLINILKTDSTKPLKQIFIESFIRAIDEHSIHYDDNAQEVGKKLKKLIKKDGDTLFNIFLQQAQGREMLHIMDDIEFRKNVSSGIISSYLNSKEDYIELEFIVLDCLSYYKSSFFKYMSEKEGIMAILDNSLEINNKCDKIIEILKANFEEHSFLEKYGEYKKAVINNFKEINFFGLGLEKYKRKKRRELSKIYVNPRLKRVNNEYLQTLNEQFVSKTLPSTRLITEDMSEDEDLDFSFSQLLSSISENKNIVILGDPGAGKSMLIKYIMYLLVSGSKSEFQNKSIYDFIPFRIELRKYIKNKRKNNYGIISYLKNVLESDYQVSLSSKKDLLNVFYCNNTLLFLDGLDEIFDVSEKIEVRDDIVNFISNYRNCKVIVTSRIIGYDDARFNNDFTELRIIEFNDEQIKEYVKKWYCQDCANNEDCNEDCNESTKEGIRTFISEIENLENEIKRNPLLLSLIIILYQNNGQLPNSKLELYKSCTKTLVDNWDEIKSDLDIRINSDLKKRKENIFSSLALWQYIESSNKSKKIKIDSKSVLRQVKKTIISLELTNDSNEAEKWAQIFIDYAEKRSLYFDNTFTHKTFWEYYTALRIFQEFYFNDQNKLCDLIQQYIGNSFWFDVIELLFNMIDEVQCSNDRIKLLIGSITSKNKIANTLFLKILPGIVNISKDTAKNVIKQSMFMCIENLDIAERLEDVNDKDKDKNSISYQVFDDLYSLINRKIYVKEIQESFDEIYYELTDENSILKYFLLYYELSDNPYIIKLNNDEKLLELLNKYPRLYIEKLILTKDIALEDLRNGIIEYYSRFNENMIEYFIPLAYRYRVGMIGLIDIYLNEQFKTENLNSVIGNISLMLKGNVSVKIFSKCRIYLRMHEQVLNYKQYLNIINETDDWNIILCILSYYNKMLKKIINKNECSLDEIQNIYSCHPVKDKIINYIDMLLDDEIDKSMLEVASSIEKD